MADNLGSASLELRVDLEKFQAELRSALSMVKQTLTEMKQGLNINVDNVNFDPIKDGLKSLPPIADNVKDSVNSTLNSFAKFELITGVINQVKGAVGELKNYVMGLGKEYADTELVQTKLESGLKRIGDGDYFERLKKQADDLHKITPFDDNDITNMQSMMTTFDGISGATIEKLTPAMLDLSSAFARAGDTGMNLQQLAIMIGKSGATEMSGALQKVGIVMDETTKSMWGTMTAAERFSAMEQILSNNTNITAEAFGKTLAGQIGIAEIAFGDIKEAIGKAFAPLIMEVSKAIQGLAGWFGELSPTIQMVIGLIGGMAIAAVALIPILSALNISLGGLPIIIGAVVAAVAGIAIYISENIDSIKAWVTEMAGGEEAVNNFTNTISGLWDGLKELWSFIVGELSGAWEEIKTNMGGVIDQFKGGTEMSGSLLDGLKTLATTGFEVLKNVIHTVIEAWLKINRAMTDFYAKNPEIVNALKFLAETGFGAAIGQAKFLINVFGTLIDWAGRVGSALIEVGRAIKALADINLADIILNPASFQANINKIITSVENVGNSFKSNTQTIANKFDYEAPIGPGINDARGGTIVQQKDKTTPPGGGNKKDGGSKDSNKEELDALKDVTAEYDHQVKLMDDKIKLGEASVDQMSALLSEYRDELTSILDSLTKTEDRRKAEEKIADLKVKQTELEKKYAEEITKAEVDKNKLIGEVDKFVDKRRAKVMDGIFKETADIELQYAGMEDKILASKLSDMDKQAQIERLNFEKSQELTNAKLNSEKSGLDELRTMKQRNNEDEYALAVDITNKKFEKEKERILKNYAEGKLRSEMLAALEIAHTKEVANIQTEAQKNVTSALQSGFQAVQSIIGNGFRNMWQEVFGEANSLFEMFIVNVIEKLTEIAASAFFTLIIKTVSGFFTGGASAAFADGGYTGSGDPREIAGVVHKDEVVVSSNALKNPGTRQMAELLNQGKSVGELIQSIMPSTNTLGMMIPDSGIVTGTVSKGNTFNLNIGGVNSSVHKLSGLTEQDWIGVVDEMMPEIAKGLHRVGKEILDTSLKN